MPTPIAHMAAGYLAYGMLRNNLVNSKKINLTVMVFCFSLSIWPDFDFIPGIFINDINRFHHGITHSLLAAFLMSLLAAIAMMPILKTRNIKILKVWACFFIASASHPILDFFSKDQSIPYGIPILWPFLDIYYMSSISLFYPVEKSGNNIESFLMSLINRNNLLAVLFECIFVVFLFFIVDAFRRYQK